MEIDLVDKKKKKKTSASSLESDHLVHACLFMSESYQNNFLLTILNCFFSIYLLATLGLHCCMQATLSCGAQASHHSGFSCQGAWALDMWALLVAAHRFSSCSSQAPGLSGCRSRAQLSWAMRDLPGPEIKPVCPALSGGFLTTPPPGQFCL